MAGIDSFTKLMLHFDEADGTATPIDSEITPKTVSNFGNFHTENTQSKFGGLSGQFDGSGDYLTLADHADWDAAAEYSVDFWAYFSSSVPADAHLIGQFDYSSTSGGGWSLNLKNGSLILSVSNSYPPNITATHGMSADTWNHIAWTRDSSNDNRLFVNGTQVGSTVNNSTSTSSTNALFIGRQPSSGTDDFRDYMDELRVSKGIARWTGNFTPPAVAYTADVTARASKMMLMGVS